MFSRLRSEAKALVKKCYEIAWYSRGGVQYRDVFDMTQFEREVACDFVEGHLEAVKKHPHPIY